MNPVSSGLTVSFMRNVQLSLFLLLFSFLCAKNSIGQTYQTYKDAADHFEISIPPNWIATQQNPKLKFIAIRPQNAGEYLSPENINLNFIEMPGGSLDSAYNQSIESNKRMDGFLAIGQNGAAANGGYKWYINTHQAPQGNDSMQTIVFVFFHKNNAVLLTCTAPKTTFDRYNATFFKIANSLRLQ